jgi:hypothetical protein
VTPEHWFKPGAAMRALFADPANFDLVPAGAGRGTVLPLPVAASPM